jgi:hypothetical protein
MMKMAFKSMSEAVKSLGEAQALADLNAGTKQRQYRKERNMKNQALLEAISGNAELKKQLETAIASKLVKKSA